MKRVPQAFWNWADSYYGNDVDLIDTEALYDNTLTVGENIALFKAQFPQQTTTRTARKPATETPTQTATITAPQTIDIDKVKSVAIIGDTGTAKTNLLFYAANQYTGHRKKYLMGYPKHIEGFSRVSSIPDLVSLRNAIVFVDELQKFIKVYDRRANTELMEILSLAEHNRLTIVFTTQLSQFITKGVEAFIDVWLLCRIRDLGSLKNGSKPKRIIQNTIDHRCSQWSLSLDNGEYLQYSERYGPEQNGVFRFPNQGVGKDWNA